MLTSREYRQADWKQFRDRVLQRDEYRCQSCGRTQDSGAVMQVHHFLYVDGRRAWEYPLEEVITLCRGCHAAEHGKIAPQNGWEYEGEEDLEDPTGECDWCGKTEIRFIHFINHPRWFPLEVGVECCGKLTDPLLAHSRLKSMRGFALRSDRFVNSAKWFEFGGEPAIIQGKYLIVINRTDDQFLLNVAGFMGKERFVTPRAAKRHAFKVLESGKLGKWFESKKYRVRQVKMLLPNKPNRVQKIWYSAVAAPNAPHVLPWQ